MPLRRSIGVALAAVAVGALLAAGAAAQQADARWPLCAGCHGAGGTSGAENVPSLGGMPADYVLIQLYLFREGRRRSEPMTTMAAGLSDDDLRSLSERVSKLPPMKPGEPLEAAERDRGLTLINRYHCNSCHGATLAGQNGIPHIAGQREEYLVAALTGYKTGTRIGYGAAMNEASQELRMEDIPVLARAVARFRVE